MASDPLPICKGITKGKLSLGSWVHIAHPAMAELMASIGFDWIAVDVEHGAVDISECLSLVQAIKAHGVVPMARLPYKDIIWVRRALDTGFMGVIVPLVNNPEEAKRMVSVAKYPPEGERGIGYAPANLYGTRAADYMALANKEITVIPQIESAEAVENVEAILDVDGVDGVFMGPYDLSGSYGILGQFDHPTMQAAYDKIISAALARNKFAGFHVVAPDLGEVQRRLDRGFNMLALSLDITLIAHGAKTMLDGSRKIAAEREA